MKPNSGAITNHPTLRDSLIQAFKDSNGGWHVARRQKVSWVKGGRGERQLEYAGSLRMFAKVGGTDRLYTWATIDALPDNVLLETFVFFLGEDDADIIQHSHNYDGWQTLVHVCRRWRCVIFASPCRLDLKLYCTPRRSVNSKTLDIWPALPIVIFAGDMERNGDETNIIAALRQHNRVCKIHYCRRESAWDRNARDSPLKEFQGSFLKEFAAINEPFLTLTTLKLSTSQQQNVPVLPDSFLGGCAPRLRSLHLDAIPYPSMGKLLSSTTDLVRLSLCRIPRSGYIAPETIVPCLSTLARLESLTLGFRHPRSQAHRENRHPPPLTRVVFPNLTFLDFSGDIEYLEDILSRIETPTLSRSYFCLFNQLISDCPLLGDFIRRTETFATIHTARIELFSLAVGVTLTGREEIAHGDKKALQFEITCEPLDRQLSAVAQVLNSISSSLPTLESLEITISHKDWQGGIEVIQWRELLHPFTAVKDMTLEFEDSIRLVAPALQEFSGERATEVLPALQNLFLRTYGWQSSGPVKTAIGKFIAARQLYGHPVAVHY